MKASNLTDLLSAMGRSETVTCLQTLDFAAFKLGLSATDDLSQYWSSLLNLIGGFG